MNFTPFSGLSLIVHLIVIGVATLSRALFKKKNSAVKEKDIVAETELRRYAKSLFSVVILLVVSGVMIFSFMFALVTGWHVGAEERQMQYVRQEIIGIGSKFEPQDASAETANNIGKLKN